VERSEAKNVKIKILDILTRSFASRFKLRFARQCLAKSKWTTYWSLSPRGVTGWSVFLQHFKQVKYAFF
jgi:hypothetical protein